MIFMLRSVARVGAWFNEKLQNCQTSVGLTIGRHDQSPAPIYLRAQWPYNMQLRSNIRFSRNWAMALSANRIC